MILLKQKITKYMSTNLSQPYNEWLKDTEYALDTTIVYKNHIYKTIVDNNKGVQPDLNTGKWLLFGVDNTYAAIDLHSATSTYIDEGLSYMRMSFDAVGFTHLAFGTVQGKKLTITERDTLGNVIKNKEYPIGIERINARNWYEYYYNTIPDSSGSGSGLPIDILIDLVQTNTATIEVIVTPNSKGEAFVGSMVGGIGLSIGDTEYGVYMGLIDYSRKETDEYGITTLVRRKSRETMECDIVAPAKHSQGNKRIVKESMGIPIMIIADPEKDTKFDNLIIFGYIDDYTTYLNNGVIARSRINIEEVI